MLTIITPCYRQHNLPHLFRSIKFEKISKWIIIYDTSKNRKYPKIYSNNPKIVEVECNKGISGNPQRNYGLSLVEDGYVYFLDDDNVIHPAFWQIIDMLDNNHFYTFNQMRDKKGRILYGKEIVLDNIDTAMYIVHKKHIKNIKWVEDRYNADGIFIIDINKHNVGLHIYLDVVGCYYNYLV